jgi:hypothetical protein
MPRAEAECLPALGPRCPLDGRFVVRDSCGAGLVLAVATASGAFLRLPAAGGGARG